MASFRDLDLDWSMLSEDPACWDTGDLQLAAELGKTLLERNKELENSIRQHQNIIDDQAQEIEYLTKQTAALREVNDSRLRIYEQLEVSIQDLERVNHRLIIENTTEKKQNKALTQNIETLESRCEELQRNLDDVTKERDELKRIQRNNQREIKTVVQTEEILTRLKPISNADSSSFQTIQNSSPKTEVCDKSSSGNTASKLNEDKSIGTVDVCDSGSTPDEVLQLVNELRGEKTRRQREERRSAELEEQLATLVQENRTLEQKVASITDSSGSEVGLRSIHEELNTLEEVRQGQLCSRCLRSVERSDDISILGSEVFDGIDPGSANDSLINESQFRSSVPLQIEEPSKSGRSEAASPACVNVPQSDNPYRVLVEKYEALLEVKRHPISSNRGKQQMSLQEELQMSGDFNSFSTTKDTDEESGHGGDGLKRNSNNNKNKFAKNNKDRKAFSRTPTDFSEAETSSSGFSDETSNKATQTEDRPGSFLCTIADGDDCKFSIYDDASPIDSRFRNRPEYRELFREIFTVLKKAAENKDEGEQLPLLDDVTPANITPKVPQVTPCAEAAPSEFTDDSQSVMSSAISEASTSAVEVTEERIPDIVKAENVENEVKKETRVLTPYKREPLDYLSVCVNARKKSSSRKSSARRHAIERSDSPVLPLSPRVCYSSRLGGGGQTGGSGRKRRDQRPFIEGSVQRPCEGWNGASVEFWSSNRNQTGAAWEFKPSTASQDLHKLKRLDLSYAEVLRNADNKKREMYAKNSRRK